VIGIEQHACTSERARQEVSKRGKQKRFKE
jgi:hypothetical protein